MKKKNQIDFIDPSLKKEDFKLVQEEKVLVDVALKTKPTTFFKDALRRFRKNKSSLVAGVVLGILILFAIIVPSVSPTNITVANNAISFLAPRIPGLENLGIFDGTNEYKQITYDYTNQVPVSDRYDERYVVGDVKVYETYINQENTYAFGGNLIFSPHSVGNVARITTNSYPISTLSPVIVYLETENNHNIGFEDANYNIYVIVSNSTNTESQEFLVQSSENDDAIFEINLNQYIASSTFYLSTTNDYRVALGFEIPVREDHDFSAINIKSLKITNGGDEPVYKMDANQTSLAKTNDNYHYWPMTSGVKTIRQALLYKCDFKMDTYAFAFSNREVELRFDEEFMKWYNAGQFEFDFESQDIASFRNISSPIERLISYQSFLLPDAETGQMERVTIVRAEVCYYKYLGFDSIPYFIFGTDNNGYDLFKKLWSGLRTSLILGFVVAFINIVIGLIWGSISGYYGGTIDLIMERFTEILGGVPWIVIMTLCILHLGQTFGVFVLALILTGWIGTSARTRSQFYRYKGREFVLASRTLGAKDSRLIFKHILPNSVGPIITSGVLMIPSVIFTEATISYLGLGFQNLDSIGITLANNQSFIMTNPYLILFPAVIVALLMICFNLFGNGLRDAFNPSLKGTE